MRVCLDARCVRHTVTGLGRYARHLIEALAAIDRTNEYLVVLDPNYKGSLVRQANFSEVRLPGRPDTLGNFIGGARHIGRLNADIYHSLHHFLPLGIKGRAMLTLHDLIWIENPDLAYQSAVRGRVIQAYAKVTMSYSLRRADHVISISEYTARRAIAHMKLDASRITVVPHGVSKRFFRSADALPLASGTDAHTNSQSSPPYFLVLGHSKPNKNVGRVIGAFALLAQRLPDVQLRVVGRGEGYDRLRTQVASLGLTERVVFQKGIPDEDLLTLFRRAVALVFPSLVEGFGLPILEAQAIGCPVVTSDRGVLPETAGDAALLVDPLDSWGIARAMERLHNDHDLRASLIERGQARAAKFTWESAAARTREVYRRLMGEPVSSPAVARDQLSPQTV